jgi:hydrogenase nickel incorporation protein HypB
MTKSDLAAAVEFDRASAMRHVADVRPGLDVLEVSARTGAGMTAWLTLLRNARQAAFNSGRARHASPLS